MALQIYNTDSIIANINGILNDIVRGEASDSGKLARLWNQSPIVFYEIFANTAKQSLLTLACVKSIATDAESRVLNVQGTQTLIYVKSGVKNLVPIAMQGTPLQQVQEQYKQVVEWMNFYASHHIIYSPNMLRDNFMSLQHAVQSLAKDNDLFKHTLVASALYRNTLPQSPSRLSVLSLGAYFTRFLAGFGLGNMCDRDGFSRRILSYAQGLKTSHQVKGSYSSETVLDTVVISSSKMLDLGLETMDTKALLREDATKNNALLLNQQFYNHESTPGTGIQMQISYQLFAEKGEVHGVFDARSNQYVKVSSLGKGVYLRLWELNATDVVAIKFQDTVAILSKNLQTPSELKEMESLYRVGLREQVAVVINNPETHVVIRDCIIGGSNPPTVTAGVIKSENTFGITGLNEVTKEKLKNGIFINLEQPDFDALKQANCLYMGDVDDFVTKSELNVSGGIPEGYKAVCKKFKDMPNLAEGLQVGELLSAHQFSENNTPLANIPICRLAHRETYPKVDKDKGVINGCEIVQEGLGRFMIPYGASVLTGSDIHVPMMKQMITTMSADYTRWMIA